MTLTAQIERIAGEHKAALIMALVRKHLAKNYVAWVLPKPRKNEREKNSKRRRAVA